MSELFHQVPESGSNHEGDYDELVTIFKTQTIVNVPGSLVGMPDDGIVAVQITEIIAGNRSGDGVGAEGTEIQLHVKLVSDPDTSAAIRPDDFLRCYRDQQE